MPSTIARPAVGVSSVESILMVVVFPAPFGPIKPKMSPASRSRFRSLPATTSLYSLRRCWIWIIGGMKRFPVGCSGLVIKFRRLVCGKSAEAVDHAPYQKQPQHNKRDTAEPKDTRRVGVGLYIC